MQISRECTPPYLSTGISNLLHPADAEVVLGQLSMNLASWVLSKKSWTLETIFTDAMFINYDPKHVSSRHFHRGFHLVSINVQDEPTCSLIGPLTPVSASLAKGGQGIFLNPRAANCSWTRRTFHKECLNI